MNWDMPVLDGPEVMRIVRSPDVFPKPNLPIIMLTDLGLRSRVHAAIRLGVHEFLVKPISPKTLQQRLLGIMLNPRPMVRVRQLLHPDAAPPRRPEGRAGRVAGQLNTVPNAEMSGDDERDMLVRRRQPERAWRSADGSERSCRTRCGL